MKKIFLCLMLLSALLSGCGQAPENNTQIMNTKYAYTNQLIHESSPYLLQHAHNPVNWYPWGDAALAKAKAENKLLIISIGYAACHWCHVMEHESFEDTEVAKIMNDHFVCIKADREERPDVDQVYMTAAQLITGSGGWPLNAIALPDGRPFYAGTYFTKKNWINMLDYFVDLQKKDPAALEKSAQQVTQGIHASETVSFIDAPKQHDVADLDRQFNRMKATLDFVQGGTNRAPKFPMPSVWEYVLHYYYLGKNTQALQAVTATLNNMAFGGIYDHLAGGFARYATDANWHVPHFEKMLYDNAQLVQLYCHAFQLTKNPLYKKTVYETLNFITQELTSNEGAFYSSLDADSDGEEGKYYVWTKAEIDQTLGADAALFSAFYNITTAGNWEHGKNILYRKMTDESLAKEFGLSLPELTLKIEAAKKKLLKVRAGRTKPGLDDKILSSWNALMLRAYATAYRVFGEDHFLLAAQKNASFLMHHAIAENGEMTRNYKNGKSSINAFLDDYAFTISAFIELYQATFDEKWLIEADKLAGYTLEHFFDPETKMFFYTHNRYSSLIARKMELSDNVNPASNSEMAKNLYLLGHYFDNEEYIWQAQQMLTNVQPDIERNTYFYSNWGILQALCTTPVFEIAIVGDDYLTKRVLVDQHYLPDAILLGASYESNLALLKNKAVTGKTMIYVCQNKTCKKPVTEVAEAIMLVEKQRN